MAASGFSAPQREQRNHRPGLRLPPHLFIWHIHTELHLEPCTTCFPSHSCDTKGRMWLKVISPEMLWQRAATGMTEMLQWGNAAQQQPWSGRLWGFHRIKSFIRRRKRLRVCLLFPWTGATWGGKGENSTSIRMSLLFGGQWGGKGQSAQHSTEMKHQLIMRVNNVQNAFSAVCALTHRSALVMFLCHLLFSISALWPVTLRLFAW